MSDKLRVDLIDNCTRAIAYFNAEKERLLQAPATVLTSTGCSILDDMLTQWELTRNNLLQEDSCVFDSINIELYH